MNAEELFYLTLFILFCTLAVIFLSLSLDYEMSEEINYVIV